MSIEIRSPGRREVDYPGGRRSDPPEPLFGPDGEMLYPDSDGRPMSDNTLQDHWIGFIKQGLELMFRDREDVFVAADLMWYPLQARNTRRLAPDVMVAFGRPKGYRGSYQQFKEADVPPTVVFEIWSPGNRRRVMDYKLGFYERYGVEEYYLFEPYKVRLDGWVRVGDGFEAIGRADGWVSPRLGIRFDVGADLAIHGPDGQPFLTHFEREDRLRDATERAEAEARLRRQESDRAERLAARLRELGLDPDD